MQQMLNIWFVDTHHGMTNGLLGEYTENKVVSKSNREGKEQFFSRTLGCQKNSFTTHVAIDIPMGICQ